MMDSVRSIAIAVSQYDVGECGLIYKLGPVGKLVTQVPEPT
jgi:hypothetical protein